MIGERVYYDERLTQFLLRSHVPELYGRWRDRFEWEGHPDGVMPMLVKAMAGLEDKAFTRAFGIPRGSLNPYPRAPEDPGIDAT